IRPRIPGESGVGGGQCGSWRRAGQGCRSSIYVVVVIIVSPLKTEACKQPHKNSAVVRHIGKSFRCIGAEVAPEQIKRPDSCCAHVEPVLPSGLSGAPGKRYVCRTQLRSWRRAADRGSAIRTTRTRSEHVIETFKHPGFFFFLREEPHVNPAP